MERGILFSSAMVRAILAGTKAQTRRALKYQPPKKYTRPVFLPLSTETSFVDDDSGESYPASCGRGQQWLTCPYGVPGDRLWVRETWRPFMEAWRSGIEYAADGGCMNLTSEHADALAKFSKIALRFPGARKDRRSEAWHPSIHLPRRFSRITLDVLSIRVERLNEISEEDARSEGVERVAEGWRDYAGTMLMGTARASFRSLWESINGAESWDANPWVWRIEFSRVTP